MKKLIYIDNDDERRAKEDVQYVQYWFAFNFENKEFQDPTIEIKADLGFMDREERINMLFDKNNVILSWSMYTYSHFNSAGQFLKFMESAAANGVEGRVYIDCTPTETLFDFLDRCPDKSLSLRMLKSIQQNYIISYDNYLGNFYRIVVTDLKDDNVFEKYILLEEDVILLLTEDVDKPI